MSKPQYTIHYWPGIPGRGEFVRLCFEYTGTPYKDPKKPYLLLSKPDKTNHPPCLAPPILETPKGAFISQTGNIVNYLAPKLGLDGTDGLTDEEDIAIRRAHVNQLFLTCLDINSEAHDVHHPISVRLKYEDQLEESGRRAEETRKFRIPKFLSYFNLVIKGNKEESDREWKHLIGSTMTTADLGLYHVIDGLQHAFPNLMRKLEAVPDYAEVFALKNGVAAEPSIAAYMKGDRREKFSHGIYRYYPELDDAE